MVHFISARLAFVRQRWEDFWRAIFPEAAHIATLEHELGEARKRSTEKDSVIDRLFARLEQLLIDSERVKRLERELVLTRVALAEAEEAAYTDHLTGLFNRRGAEYELMRSIAEMFRIGYAAGVRECSLSLLFLDLDNFKVINDRYGHAAGDSVLVALSEVLKHLFRPTDVIVRLGGDEFAVCLVGTGPEGGRHRAENLIRILDQDERFAFGDVRVSASIGVVHAVVRSVAGGARAWRELKEEADRLMYRAKHRKNEAGGIEDSLEILAYD
jgi:diguanylate cyclase (GGDEF)-like protein